VHRPLRIASSPVQAVVSDGYAGDNRLAVDNNKETIKEYLEFYNLPGPSRILIP
jgi:hypothetical protein